MISEPQTTNDRGFLAYAGGDIETTHGHTIRVYESSAASGPHVWLNVGDSDRVPGHTPHLSLEQAITLRAALDQFIEGVPERWEDGAEMLADARRAVFGSETDDPR